MKEPAVGAGDRHGAIIRMGFLIVAEVHGWLSPIKSLWNRLAKLVV
jgi:hypothetical protein